MAKGNELIESTVKEIMKINMIAINKMGVPIIKIRIKQIELIRKLHQNDFVVPILMT